ncbi:MAG TPA: hypothetical protein VK554_00515 [Bradyrhizobium sp.]|nr:hypothetical protein [Bradyrhizobium sp.]
MIRRRSALLHMAGGMPVLRLMAVVLAGVMILHVLAALFTSSSSRTDWCGGCCSASAGRSPRFRQDS